MFDPEFLFLITLLLIESPVDSSFGPSTGHFVGAILNIITSFTIFLEKRWKIREFNLFRMKKLQNPIVLKREGLSSHYLMPSRDFKFQFS